MTKEELAELQKMVTVAAGEIEGRLATSLDKTIEGINNKIDLAVDLNAKSKAAFETIPSLIQEQIESQLKVNLKGIVEEVGNQFEGKMKAMAGGNSAAPGGGLNFESLLANSDKIVAVVNAFRSPTTEAAMLAQMNFVMKWHSLLSKLEKGGGAPDEITKAIASTFTTEKKE